MKDLLVKVNEAFDNSINANDEETGLQIRILKSNINKLFNEAMTSEEEYTSYSEAATTPVAPTQATIEVAQAEVVPTIGSKTVLIVDDSVIIRNYLQKLCGSKYFVSSLNSGQDAINEIRNINPDLLLLDLMMPGIDGFGVLDFLKSNNITVPVIIISGDTTKESIDRAFEYNVVDMIEKPFSEATIMSKIDRILN